MMISLTSATFPLKQLAPNPCIAVISTQLGFKSSRENLHGPIDFGSACAIRTDFEKRLNLRSFRVPAFRQRSRGYRGKPDAGRSRKLEKVEDEDEDEEEEEEEEDSEWEGDEERVASSASSSLATASSSFGSDVNKELIREIELLLDPEERAIWSENEGPDLDKISTGKWSLLHSLAIAGQIHHMDMLLENGLNIDTVDEGGLTALHLAIICKKEAVISHLLRKGANPNVKDPDGASPLHFAVEVGAMQTVKLLIKYNVDVNVADADGWTPLHVAVQSRNRDIIKILLVNGADKTRRTMDGKTALDLALCYGKDFKSYDLVKLLKLVPADRDY